MLQGCGKYFPVVGHNGSPLTNNPSVPLYCNTADDVPRAVASFVQHHQLLKDISRLGVAVSGGADSVALMHLLLALCSDSDIELVILHLNHGLRQAALTEAAYVKSLAQQHSLEYSTAGVNLESENYIRAGSLEMRARVARMEFFTQQVKSLNLDGIATGHNADDVAELVLMRLMRGAGSTGIAGLSPCSWQGNLLLLRPLLGIAGGALRGWLQKQGLEWYLDESNQDITIQRNYIRHVVLPGMDKTLPGVAGALCQSAEILREDDALLSETARNLLHQSMCTSQTGKIALNMQIVLQHPVALQRRILREWFFFMNMESLSGYRTIVEILARCVTGHVWQHNFNEHIRLGFAKGELGVVPPLESAPIPLVEWEPLLSEETSCCRWGKLEFSAFLGKGIDTLSHGIGVYPAKCSFELATVAGKKFYIRARQPGDLMQPTGFAGTRKIKELLIDAKVPYSQRDSIPLLLCEERVVWIPGFRIDRKFMVKTPDSPSLVITCKLICSGGRGDEPCGTPP